MGNRINLIDIKEASDILEFWKKHEEYLIRDIFKDETLDTTSNQEDKAWFLSKEYRENIEKLSKRPIDTLHFILFEKAGVNIGFCTYCTYFSEDGKCFIIDFCIYPEFRSQGYGKLCFNSLKESQYEIGASYFELNVANKNAKRFWKSTGFVYNGYDEHGSKLYQLPPREYDEFKCINP